MLSVRRVKAKTIGKNKRMKVPKTDPQQQRFLKTCFKKKSSVPQNQKVWRRTVVQTKPKKKFKIPKLFRIDRVTGLPVDYEMTVHRVMHYVNPHLSNQQSAEEVLEELLTKMFAKGMIQCCQVHQQVNKLHSLLKNNCKCQQISKIDKDSREANENLSNFHSACKLGPRRILSPKLGPTYMSRFNFNQLRIKST
ncbi:uncharacterized protein LOC128253517 [Drosophila gunungcola]|uniref:Uncharacterized protein n=1 Tax=Drosophila gunungcola TaxID=103775 RepID=A0A9P9YF19_9MUSC|nr:uncharacterized protein LOC128253517 [Drosophila gunungcola]KAI8035363.1 hypothetical protein M5D96_011806 [Drosophila gunungcola]